MLMSIKISCGRLIKKICKQKIPSLKREGVWIVINIRIANEFLYITERNTINDRIRERRLSYER